VTWVLFQCLSQSAFIDLALSVADTVSIAYVQAGLSLPLALSVFSDGQIQILKRVVIVSFSTATQVEWWKCSTMPHLTSPHWPIVKHRLHLSLAVKLYSVVSHRCSSLTGNGCLMHVCITTHNSCVVAYDTVTITHTHTRHCHSKHCCKLSVFQYFETYLDIVILLLL